MMRVSLSRRSLRWVLPVWLAAWLSPALAHHPMGGMTPATLWQGLLSGFGHPVIEADHLMFLLAAGVLCGAGRIVPRARALWLAALFASAAMAGTLLRVPGVVVPFGEAYVAVSLIVVAACLLAGRLPGAGLATPLAVAAGLAHGYAFGETVIGAEATPIAGYLVGLALTQTALLFSAFFLADAARRRSPAGALLTTRLTAFAAAAVAVVALVR
jgi:urease accessory protein